MKSNSKLAFLVVALFVVAPFVMSFEDLDRAELTLARTLPTYISTIASFCRWGLLVILSLISLYLYKTRQDFRITTPIYFLSLFYFIQFIYAFTDGVDYLRFLLMTIFSLLIPPVIGFVIKEKRKVVKHFIYAIIFFLLLSIALNGHLVLIGQRFFGFLNNANTYGISTVFWFVILMIAFKFNNINKKAFLILAVVLFLTMLFSGSRSAMVGMFLVFIVNYSNQYLKMVKIGVSLLLVFLVFSYFVDLSFVTNRLENIGNSTKDSGREEIWSRAYHAIQQNFWWGNGMDANYRVADTGNMHNCYIRFLLNMGGIFSALALLMYILSIRESFLERKKVPFILLGYLLAFALMNVGEDFFVGLGSSVFIYLLFIYGFINYYISYSNGINR